jgi:hypothetical protein
LKDLLASRGVDIGAWSFNSAVDVSADGLKIAGSGYNPAGQSQAWLIDLSVPEPPSAVLALCSLLLLVRFRRLS